MNKRSGARINVLLIVFVIIVIGMAFVAGTLIGFNTAISNIESCVKVNCGTLGGNITATSCEICKQSILRIGAG